MRAVEITKDQQLCIATLPVPAPQKGEVLIRVAYAGVNHADIFQTQGKYPAPAGASPVPGLEVSGVVEALGESSVRYKVGDSVCALLAGGGYAEYAVAPEALCLPLPTNISMAEAATLPEAWCTTWFALCHKAQLQAGETLLIQGGASGVGSAAIQLARLIGAVPIATAGSEEKRAFCEALGAIAINYRQEDFKEATLAHTSQNGVDVVLDMVGGDYVGKHLSLLKRHGQLVMIAFLESSRVEANLAPLLLKELSLHGFTLRAQTLEAKATIMRNVEQLVWPALARKEAKPVLDQEFVLEDAQKALDFMAAGKHKGKIVLKT